VARNLHDVVDTRTAQDGTKTSVTVMDRIEEAMRTGGFLHDAAARVGIVVETLRDWRRQGAKAHIEILNGRKTPADLTQRQLQYLELAQRMEKAETDARLHLLATAQKLAAGGIPQKKTTVRRIPARGGNPETIETVEETTTTLPDAGTIRWLLSHRWPNDFAGRVELTGPEGGPIHHDVTNAMDQLRAQIDAIGNNQQPPALPEATGNGHQ
jgi:transposase-like protein